MLATTELLKAVQNFLNGFLYQIVKNDMLALFLGSFLQL